jgi:CheY-like chemotaxis protein
MKSKPPHILIVDDNPENIRVLGTALASYKYQITVATNGEIALKAAEEHIPDLMLLDVMMPKIDGFEVCGSLKANPKTQAIEIIFVTAVVAPSEELKGISLGAVDYIHKPFSIPVVQAKVALHLERARCKKVLELKNAALEEVAKLREDIDNITRHDLTTPLNNLLFYSQLMLNDKDLSAKSRLNLDAMLKEGTKILYMINNSLDIFKMETGRYPCHFVRIDMVSVINRIIKDLQSLTEPKKITVLVRVEGRHVKEEQFFISADDNLCYSLFTHLIRDAVEVCNMGNVLVIEMHHENNEGVIAITNPDTIPESIRATFFDKQLTADPAQNTESGIFAEFTTPKKVHYTRQGAYSAKLMTSTQNGTIAVTTNNKETCITVRLPISR